MTRTTDGQRERRILDDAKGAPDSRDAATAADAQRWSAVVRCMACGREVREDWTPEQTEDGQPLCGRCREMANDPDTKRD